MDRTSTSNSLLPLPPKSSEKALWPHISLTTAARVSSHTILTVITTAELTFQALGTTQCQDRIPMRNMTTITLTVTSSVLVRTHQIALLLLHPPSPTIHCHQHQTTLLSPHLHTHLVCGHMVVATTFLVSATSVSNIPRLSHLWSPSTSTANTTPHKPPPHPEMASRSPTSSVRRTARKENFLSHKYQRSPCKTY
jgi:hypothetical protein